MLFIGFIHWLLDMNIWLALLVFTAWLAVVMFTLGFLVHLVFKAGDAVTSWWARCRTPQPTGRPFRAVTVTCTVGPNGGWHFETEEPKD